MRIRTLVAASAIGVVAAPAFAADLGTPEPLPTPPVAEAAPANNWTGFYLGALLGYTWGKANTSGAGVGDVDTDGIDGGGYVGYNYQLNNNFVIGAEADLLASASDGDKDGLEVDQGINGSLRARAGFALDRFLFYGTGGVALTDLKIDAAGAGDASNTLWGWTIGAGTEAMITPNITARIEYRYTDYQDKDFDLGGGAGSVDSGFSTNSVRAGVGLKF
jgi:outer membrane immunogenic protein